MANILLCSEAFVKSVTSISENLSGKYLLPSLREAQEQGLRSVLGDNLLEKLKSLVADNTISASSNSAYKNLVDRCQYFLAYSAIVEVMRKTTFKVGNFGLAKSTDENLQVATEGEVEKMEYYYQSKADSYCVELQNFILENRTDYPELTEHCCHKMESNLHSAASCGIFLGGARGKIRVHRHCERR